MKDNTPLYRYPGSHAREHGELEQYRASNRANLQCKESIEAAIREHYRDNCLDPAGARQVLDDFGAERVTFLLAHTIRWEDWDLRYSRDNKTWAQTIPVYPNPDFEGHDRNANFIINSHPGLVDLFTDQTRADLKLRQQEKASVRKQLKETPSAPAQQLIIQMLENKVKREKSDSSF